MTLAVAVVVLLALASFVVLMSALRLDRCPDRGFDICASDGFRLSETYNHLGTLRTGETYPTA